MRIGSVGEFLNTGKEFDIGKEKKGIRIQPSHLVGITAYKTLDFRREVVHGIFPGHDLHGIVSPTTNLSREGIIAPTTQVDAGYHGTLNWTLTNASSTERHFIHKECIYRLMIFKLEEEESPEYLYSGDYQSQIGYVRSRRADAPVGMKKTEWEDAFVEGGPEDMLEHLISCGYPWHILGSRLKEIDQQFKSVTEEYSDIYNAISNLSGQVEQIRERQSDTPETVRKVLREEASSLQNRWLIGVGSLFLGFLGIGLSVSANTTIWNFLKQYDISIGIMSIAVAAVVLALISRQK
ncbi:hypothetical protein HY792_02470 [Candidatus Desantisbacteria bacterium]|nr:hypothetical protein [Candidatus Desantisbacteria bacterium]